MLKIKNSEWQYFSNGVIIEIANELGCPCKYPEIERNKFLTLEYAKYEHITDFTTQEEYDKEVERVNKINNERFDEYMNNIIEWLKGKRYTV